MYIDETISDILVQMIDREFKNGEALNVPNLT